MEDKKYPHIEEKPMSVSEPTIEASGISNYSITGNTLFEMLSAVKTEDIPSAIKYLADKLALANKNTEERDGGHKWDNYQLSPEIIAMAPPERKDIYGDYTTELIKVLEKKYR